MARKWDNLTQAYQSNVFPGMLDDASTDLGVSTDSLERLGVGWAPIIQFKKGLNYQGWWTIPERNAVGEVVGLSLRSLSGFKCSYPGSGRGLTYEVNPQHTESGAMKLAGYRHFARIGDLGIVCPLCGKPDGCLVSADNPSDPNAVICIRTPSKRQMGLGYLHKLKPDLPLKAVPVLAENDKPVLVVEGMTDVATAMDMGFVAVGRPSNLGGMGLLADLLRRRQVVVLGENDDLNPITGRSPGYEGMVAAYQVLRKTAQSVRMIMPPKHVKDLRQWQQTDNITAEDLLEYVKDHSTQAAQNIILPDSKPLTVAKMFMNATYRMSGRYIMRHWRDQWFLYTGTKYEELDEKQAINGPLYEWADDKQVTHETKNGDQSLQPLICSTRLVRDVKDALYAPSLAMLPIQQAPAWINHAEGPNPADLIPFTNGLLSLPALVSGAPEADYLLDHTPDLFSTFCLPFDFDATAQCPSWLEFLDSSLGDEPEKISLLQEWFGYCLTSDNRYQKLMLLRGPRRSGKGTIMNVLRTVVGAENTASKKLAELGSQFGLEELPYKQLVLVGEAMLPRDARSSALETLLTIVGGDPVGIPRKFKTAIPSMYLPCKFTLAANEFPRLQDGAGALEARMLILTFTRSFYGREDFGLLDRLTDEAAGIINWSLEGLRALRSQKGFSTPPSLVEAKREWQMWASPIAAFLEANVCHSPDGKAIEKDRLYASWIKWAESRGLRPESRTIFDERVRLHIPYAASGITATNRPCWTHVQPR